MNPDLCDLLRVLACPAVALVFLLVGWRLGRESAGRPMFDYPLSPAPPEDAVLEADPWDEAAFGRPAGPVAVDIFETLSPPAQATREDLTP
ncbi:hypothetical protein DFW101_2463 [Solidesulfovibrio carbinoliphilus subsp. oakridgensis]|uniref:Uncharacterized protein n=1 Tax=Solidesulfovibrio carbinoliphilus subsp. oakridgensis TaxID=694327 RepID=G7Q6Y4_9BACT|nr:hypothetical protein [Solidesulfovibrio carbinoliphilus]EHJ48467.1 hypothetical protein DFW101_2463 [Solidesulfovibrio carbinoliphilus subsp. oakridgensis]